MKGTGNRERGLAGDRVGFRGETESGVQGGDFSWGEDRENSNTTFQNNFFFLDPSSKRSVFFFKQITLIIKST